jgi:hypothetical protein
MGGFHLVDHYAIYNSLGIQAQFSFDVDPNAVARQQFNRPTDATVCEEMNSADLPSRIDDIVAAFPRKSNLIVWLDYTSANRGAQLQEVVQTLVRLKHGDILRVTLNASPTSCDKFKDQGYSSPAEMRAALLRNQIENFMPTDIVSINDGEFQNVLVRSLELAAREAERLKPELRINPVLLTTYKDGTRMVTATCAIQEVDQADFPSKVFARWKFACKGWSDVQMIHAPLLSPREQQKLDSRIKRGPSRMKSALPFLLGEDDGKSLDALRSYRDFHRYYPSFRHVDD